MSKVYDIENTLIVIKTEYNKICGGFTSLPWVNENDTGTIDK